MSAMPVSAVRYGAYLILLCLISLPLEAGLSCHIHPPAEVQKDVGEVMIVGPFASTAACQQGNALLYSGQGRCHCSFDSSAKSRGIAGDVWQGVSPQQGVDESRRID